MNGIDQLGYLRFEVSDLDAWETFATEVLGVGVVDRSDEGMGLRWDGHARRVYLSRGPADDLVGVGLESPSVAALEGVVERLRGAGIEVGDSDAAAREARQVEALYFVRDPARQPLELYAGPVMAAAPFASGLVRSGFVADELGMGHCVLRARNLEESTRFYTELMGCVLSDHIVTKIGDYEVNIAFTHLNGRHHSIALGCGLPKRIHHFLLQVGSLDDVGMAFDRVVDRRIRVIQTIGRHPNDRMVSFYAQTPSGFEFEYGWGGIEVDDATWSPTTYDRVSEWGHRPPRYERPRE